MGSYVVLVSSRKRKALICLYFGNLKQVKNKVSVNESCKHFTLFRHFLSNFICTGPFLKIIDINLASAINFLKNYWDGFATK